LPGLLLLETKKERTRIRGVELEREREREREGERERGEVEIENVLSNCLVNARHRWPAAGETALHN